MSRIFATFVLLGIALGVLGARGLELSTDGVAYVTMARSILDSATLQSWSGEAQGWWPPGYALLLAPLDLPLGVLPLRLSLLHGLLWALTAGLILVATRGRELTTSLALSLGFFASAVSVEVFSFALSEALFLPLLAGFFVVLQRWRERGSGARLLLVGVLLALLPLTRTLGLAAVPVFVLAAWRERRRTGAIRPALLALTAVVPVTAWLLRNRVLFGELLPAFPGEPRPLVDTLRRTSEVVLRWWIPQVDSSDVLRICGLLVAVALVLWSRPARCTRRGWLAETARRARTSAALQFAVFFLALHLYGSATRLVDRPDDRVLAPLFLAGVFLLVEMTGAPEWRRRGATVLVAAWSLYSAGLGLAHWQRSPPDTLLRRSLTAHTAVSDSIRASVDAYSGLDPVVTNIPARVHWHTGRRASWEALRLPAPELSGVEEIIQLEGTGRDYLLGRTALRDAGWEVETPMTAPLLLRRRLNPDG